MSWQQSKDFFSFSFFPLSFALFHTPPRLGSVLLVAAPVFKSHVSHCITCVVLHSPPAYVNNPAVHAAALSLPNPVVSPTCSLLADVGQVVVTGYIVPFAVLVGDHHHTVLSARKEVIRLVFTPVLILLWTESVTVRFKYILYIYKQLFTTLYSFLFFKDCCCSH